MVTSALAHGEIGQALEHTEVVGLEGPGVAKDPSLRILEMPAAEPKDTVKSYVVVGRTFIVFDGAAHALLGLGKIAGGCLNPRGCAQGGWSVRVELERSIDQAAGRGECALIQ